MYRKHIVSLIFLVITLPFLFSCSQGNDQDKGDDSTPAIATVGLLAPDFSLQDTDGKTWTLSELRGNVVFINFWATWCAPCREEMPSMERLKKGLAQEKFIMLTIVSRDDPAKAVLFAKQLNATFPVLGDPDDRTGYAYGLTGVPETYIVDPAGILREKFLGPRPWDSPWGMELIKKYLH